LINNIRYQLNNFSPEYAKAIIEINRTFPTNLEPALIDALVDRIYLAELGEVRPIELQVVRRTITR
jgi:hypothetical protein